MTVKKFRGGVAANAQDGSWQSGEFAYRVQAFGQGRTATGGLPFTGVFDGSDVQ